MANVPKPLIFDKTGKEIIQKLTEQNAILGAIAKKQMNINDDWSSIQDIVNSGNAENIFSIGGLFTDTYTNVDASNKPTYENKWHVNDFRDFETESGETLHGMILQQNYATLQGVPFSWYRAFLACPNGLSAGTYSVTFGATWSKAIKGSIYSFTLTKAVPNGGRLAGFRTLADVSDQSKYAIYSYGADGKTLTEQVTATKVSAVQGTDLGTMNYDTRNGNLNSMQEAGYGCNRWKTSAIRQWLNSDKPKGSWWVAQDEFDTMPDQANTVSGYLAGFTDEFKSKLKTVKVSTVGNTPTLKNAVDVTYDKVFLPSLEEMFVSKQVNGEGTFHKYWKMRAGTTSPVPAWKDNDRYISYALENHNSAQYVRLRSASVGGPSDTWSVYSTGGVDSYSAYRACRALPLVVI